MFEDPTDVVVQTHIWRIAAVESLEQVVDRTDSRFVVVVIVGDRSQYRRQSADDSWLRLGQTRSELQETAVVHLTLLRIFDYLRTDKSYYCCY